jgi:paraquat-inducible protein B
MRRQISPTLVGGFVLGAVALAIAAVMILWGGRLFTRSHPYVLYFTGNVNGLRQGAPVKFKGVQVGYVEHILLSLSEDGENRPPVLTIPVVVELNSDTVVHRGQGFLDLHNPAVVEKLVQQGLRGQIATESLVTGILYISLDLRPGTKPIFEAPPRSRYVEIPTIPTPFEEAQELAMRALTKLGQVDLDQLLANLTETIKRASEIAGSPQLKATVDALPGTIKSLGDAADSIQKLANTANQQMAATSDALRKTSANAALALEQTQATLKTVSATIGPGSPISYQLGQTLTDLSQAARAMRDLAQYLDRNPSAIIRGRPSGEMR